MVIWENNELSRLQILFWEIIHFILSGKEGRRKRLTNEGLFLAGVLLYTSSSVDSFSFHGNLMPIGREGNSPGHAPRLQSLDAMVLDTCDQDSVLLSTRDSRTYLHHIRCELTLSSNSTWLG